MKIRILWVGRTKEGYLLEGINHYLKLLRNAARISIIEIKDERGKDRQRTVLEEGKRILSQTSSYVLLDERGTAMDSAGFANFLSRRDSIDFIIGGHYGVSEDVRQKAGIIISLSKMTFTHEMVRLIFLEQLFRSITIIKGNDYHH